MTLDAYDRVTARLSEVTGYSPSRANGDWRCPAHDDNTASLSVNRGRDGVILHCHANCETDDILRELGLAKKDLFDTNGDGPRRDEPTSIYKYVDERGVLLFEVLRYPNKQFRQRKPDGNGGHSWKIGSTRRVLYRLPAVVAAVQEGRPVFVVEGEKDVHAIESAGGVATCNAGGAGKWRAEYADILTGADVLVVPDQDPPGQKHAADIEASLVGKARRVRIVAPAVGKDAADHLAAGHTLDEWLAVGAPNELERTLLGSLIAGGVPDPHMVHSWLYAGGLHSIQSEPGVGKSWIALWLCVDLMQAGWAVVYLDEEGGERLVASRLEALGADPDMVDRLFHYYPFPQRTWTDSDIAALEDVLNSAGASVAAGFFDSLPDFITTAGLSEDSSTDVTSFIQRILRPFREIGAALVVLDHLRKPEQSISGAKTRSRYARGSGAKLSKAHLTLLLETVTEFDRSHSGKLRMFATKDREGFTGLPRIGDTGYLLNVNVDNHGKTVTIVPAGEADTEEWDGPTHCMDEICVLLRSVAPQELSQNQIETTLTFSHTTVRKGLEKLRDTGRVRFRPGPRSSLLYSAESDENQAIA